MNVRRILHRKNRALSFAAAAVGVLLVLFFSLSSVWAASSGSVTIHCVYHADKGDVKLAGDTYSLIMVADATVDTSTGNVSYQTKEAFAAYDCDWHNCTSSQLQKKADVLKQAVSDHHIAAQTKITDEAGEVIFDNLDSGLYLIFRSDTASGNKKYIDMPMLISVPQVTAGEAYYQVEAYPKFSEEGTTPHNPINPSDPTLPQTGQLIWPIPVLFALGFLSLGAGIVLNKRAEKEAHEA